MFCTEEGCKAEAEFSYIWPWGTQGVCCGQHRLTLQQKAQQQIKRGSLHFTVLNPGKLPDLSRDERTQLRARILTLEDELQAKDARVADIVKDKEQLATVAHEYRTKANSLSHELKEAHKNLDVMRGERDKAKAQAGEAIAERDRLDRILREASKGGAQQQQG